MPCSPGPVPVAKLDQATGDWGGLLVASGAKLPISARRPKFGRLPSSIHRWARTGSIPSKPTMIRRLAAGGPSLSQPLSSPVATNPVNSSFLSISGVFLFVQVFLDALEVTDGLEFLDLTFAELGRLGTFRPSHFQVVAGQGRKFDQQCV